MKLYYWDTLNPRKACAVAKYLNSPVEFVPVDLGKGEHKRPEYLAINPNGVVPALEDSGKTLWESNAIMCYLADKAGSDLWPHDERQIEIIRWLSWDALEFAPQAGTFYFEHIIKPRYSLGDPDATALERATVQFKRFAGVLNNHLRGRDYLVGDGLTVADFAVAASLPYADEAGIPLDGFSEIQRWHARLNELEAWRHPFPD
ncbi:glutathione S-transferase family protein [Rhodospirillaceae bacterium SYSU D60014]|uniref:glutathione S-transferase family protein n=1 Tax=Virgifigura deserti TaxID=2268457 RepID=UPI000E65F650